MIYRLMLYGACFCILAAFVAVMLAFAAIFWFFVAIICHAMGWAPWWL